MEYDVNDLIKLRSIIYKTENIEKHRIYLYDIQVISMISKIHTTIQMPSTRTLNEIFKKWLTPEEGKFLYEVPFREVPLYVNKERLKYLVRWRLNILK